MNKKQKRLAELLSKRNDISQKNQNKITKIYKNELDGLLFYISYDLIKQPMGGTLKYITLDTKNIYAGILINIQQIKDTNIFLLTLKGNNGFYTIKSTEYHLYYSPNYKNKNKNK